MLENAVLQWSRNQSDTGDKTGYRNRMQCSPRASTLTTRLAAII
jgi:hypothetical protein